MFSPFFVVEVLAWRVPSIVTFEILDYLSDSDSCDVPCKDGMFDLAYKI